MKIELNIEDSLFEQEIVERLKRSIYKQVKEEVEKQITERVEKNFLVFA